jgi:hypothetical protein
VLAIEEEKLLTRKSLFQLQLAVFPGGFGFDFQKGGSFCRQISSGLASD